jgi:DNA-binding protein H-NS
MQERHRETSMANYILIDGFALSLHLTRRHWFCFGGDRHIMARDLEKMSLRELQEMELKIKKARAGVEDRSRAELRKKIEDMVAAAGFKMSDIFGGRGGKGRTVAAKYVNPDNPAETWTGRGRKPRWLTAKLKEGGKMDKYIIK